MGDNNTAFFNRAVKIRSFRNSILCLYDNEGEKTVDPQQVKKMAVEFYQNLLGVSKGQQPQEVISKNQIVMDFQIVSRREENLLKDDSDMEIQQTLFSMDNEKDPALMTSKPSFSRHGLLFKLMW